MPFVRGRRPVKNAVDRLSISTSGPELWPFEVCRIVPPLGGKLSRNPSSQISPTNTFGRSWAVLGYGGKKIICPFFGSNSFSTLKFADIFGLRLFTRNPDAVNIGVMVEFRE